MEINQGSFTDLVDVINSLGIPVHALVGVFSLIGTQTLTTDVLYKAWQTYQSSPAFKSMGGANAARAAS